MKHIIDAHIHLDHYKHDELSLMLDSLDPSIQKLISVSFDLSSCMTNQVLAKKYPFILPAYGFHPEQEIPNDRNLSELFDWITVNQGEMVAIGEVGLPYYSRKEKTLSLSPYIELMEIFIKMAKEFNKPIILHAVYEDAPLVCDLLEKHSFTKAHFHWFKGDNKTIQRMITNGYYISITPDVLYEKEIQELVSEYPLCQLMVETDGPWPFEGPFNNQMTHPTMIHHSIKEISKLKSNNIEKVYDQILKNTQLFYSINS
ncbi:TatD family hydrolase [Cytobacillus spongiae]|uniref:TatD family hydrolase n=1 Tax=Cytobacillus spongiae TaxID=2901381 RepID=UPI001F4801DF|nr:TatD family hydrolase [Cytobacillus spongiae]UII57125.1 TatD family hydrolase [Cytobacillus spongiae]